MSHSDVDWAAEKIDDFVADAAPKLSCPSPFLRLNLEINALGCNPRDSQCAVPESALCLLRILFFCSRSLS